MKALILNSGLGHRMGHITKTHPKCMTELNCKETILSRQLGLLVGAGITEVVMTTGYYETVLIDYCKSLDLPLHIEFVNNPLYSETNYIYSIYCAREFLDDDIILMHGDLVFEASVLDDLLTCENSCMKVSSTIPLPDKDFKAVLKSGECFSLKHLAVTGDDLLSLGLRGPELGEMLKFLLEYVMEYPDNNKREILLELAKYSEES